MRPLILRDAYNPLHAYKDTFNRKIVPEANSFSLYTYYPLTNVFHHWAGQPNELVSFRQDYLLPHQRDMSQQQNAQLSNKEGRI
jgi:hypothetical protein